MPKLQKTQRVILQCIKIRLKNGSIWQVGRRLSVCLGGKTVSVVALVLNFFYKQKLVFACIFLHKFLCKIILFNNG